MQAYPESILLLWPKLSYEIGLFIETASLKSNVQQYFPISN
jgi:hypothetical protein